MYTFINMYGFCNSFLFHVIFALIIFIEAKCNLMSVESNKTGLNFVIVSLFYFPGILVLLYFYKSIGLLWAGNIFKYLIFDHR